MTSVLAEVWSQRKWRMGSLSSNRLEIRRDAIKEIKSTIDLAEEVRSNQVNLWFGQDGNDYAFQANYLKVWREMVEGVRKSADYAQGKDIEITIEYKMQEPRKHCMIDTAKFQQQKISSIS